MIADRQAALDAGDFDQQFVRAEVVDLAGRSRVVADHLRQPRVSQRSLLAGHVRQGRNQRSDYQEAGNEGPALVLVSHCPFFGILR